MMLTTAQLVILKAAIDADPVLAAFPLTPDGASEIAASLNLEASPAFYVWRTQYTPDLMRAAIVNGITQLDALTASKRDSLLWLAQGTVNMALTATRDAINDLTGSQATLKAAVLDGGKRTALRVEKILATGTGTFASPAVLGYEGGVTRDDVEAARAL